MKSIFATLAACSLLGLFSACFVLSYCEAADGQCIDHSPQWIGDQYVTYNLIDDLGILSDHSEYAFGYTRAGNLLAQGMLDDPQGQSQVYVFFPSDSLTPNLVAGQYQSELFVTSKKSLLEPGWRRISWNQIPDHTVVTNTQGEITEIDITIPDTYSPPFYIHRYLHFEPLNLDNSTTRLVTLIHGWNRVATESPYEDDDPATNDLPFEQLSQNISSAVSKSGWDLTMYDWHLDASTGGGLDWHSYYAQNAPEAAEIAHQHGQHLGERIICEAPGIQQVHLIAHSAGAWVARSAATHLTSNGISVQVTLLDPFVAAQVNGGTVLDVTKLDDLVRVPNITRLENYYVVDETDLVPGNATSQTFKWDINRDINLRVWDHLNDEHDDPVLWYAQSVVDENEIPSGEDPDDIGWRASMFYREQNAPPPDAPTGITASDGQFSNKIRVIWNNMTGVDGYYVYRATTQNGLYQKVTTNVGSLNNLYEPIVPCSTGYWYRVAAYDAQDESAWSVPEYGYTSSCPLPVPDKTTGPVPPVNEQSASVEPVLSWNSSAGATRYDVYIGTDSTPDSGEFAGTTTSTSFTPGLLNGNTVYYWRIDAKNAENTTMGDTWNFKTEDVPPPDDPYEPNNDINSSWHPGWDWEGTWLSSIDGLGIQFDDDWYEVDVTSGFERVVISCLFTDLEGDIDIALYDASRMRLDLSQSGTDNEFIDFEVPSAGKYYIRVWTADGGQTYDLWWDDLPRESPPPSTPTGVLASDGTYIDKIRLAWNNVSNEDGYRIYRATLAGGSYSEIGATAADDTDYDDNDPICGGGTTYYYKVQAYSSSGVSGLSAYDSGFTAECQGDPIPRSYYSLDEGSGSEANDSVSTYDGTVQGATWASPGQSARGNSSLVFDAVGDAVQLPNDTINDLPAGSFSCWIYPTARLARNSYIVSKQVANVIALFDIFINPNGKVDMNVGGNAGFTESVGTIPLNTWTHIALTWDGTVKNLYIDGNFDNSGGYASVSNSPNTTYIGRAVTDSNDRFAGRIDEVKIWNQALTPEEVWSEADTRTTVPRSYYSLDEGSGSEANDSVSTYDGTVRGATWASPEQSARGNSSLVFDAVGDAVQLPNDTINDLPVGSFSCWIFPTAHLERNSYIISKQVANVRALFDIFITPDGKVDMNVGGNAGFTESVGTIPLNTWTHIALTWDGTVKNLYIDGNFDNSGGYASVSNSPNTTYIGRAVTDSNDRFVGRIDEVKIWNQALTPEEVRSEAVLFSSEVWVEFDYTDVEDGTFDRPYNTLAEARSRVAVGGTIYIKPPARITEAITISKALRIELGNSTLARSAASTSNDTSDTWAQGLVDESTDDSVESGRRIDSGGGVSNTSGDTTDIPFILDKFIYEPVLPYSRADDEAYAAAIDSRLSLRVRADHPIDLNSLWADVAGYGTENSNITWTFADGDTMDDLWVHFRAQYVWAFDERIETLGGATTMTGDQVSSNYAQFRIESEISAANPDSELSETVWQPDAGDEAPSNVSVLLGAPDHPELADAPYLIYAIRPEAVYDEPQQVWLPLPDDVDPSSFDIYYYHPNGDDRGWYPAEHVIGWLVPNSHMTINIDGVTYFGFLVRHAGIVQITEALPIPSLASIAMPFFEN